MSDNVTLPATGTAVATDDVGGVQYQRVKLDVGGDGASLPLSAANPLPASVAALPLPAGAATEATIAALLVAANAIKAAAEALNGKTTAVNTGAIAGTVALDSGSLAALETISVANFPSSQAVTLASQPLPTGAATEATVAAMSAKLPTPGQAAMAASQPVTLASDQSALSVIGIRKDADTADGIDGAAHRMLFNALGRLKVSASPADLSVATGSIVASGGVFAIAVSRLSNLSITMAATSLVGHNATFEYSNNSTNGTDGNWYTAQVVRSNANTVETATGVLAATPAYGWSLNVSEFQWFRVRATAHTSGTAAYIFSPSAYASEPIPAAQVTATQPISGSVTPGTPLAGMINSTAGTNGTVSKSSGTTLYGGVFANTGGATAYVKFHNSTTVTAGTTAVSMVIAVPAGGNTFFDVGALGTRYATGLCYSITGGAADNDTTAVLAGQVKGNLSFI